MLIDIHGLTKDYSSATALRDVSVTLEPGVVALLGRNGAGKSTLLSILAGLVRESGGTVSLSGDPVSKDRSELRAAVTLLPQSVTLDHSVSARTYLEYLLDLRGIGDVDVTDALSRFGLAEVADRPLGSLSGGMRQRVGLSYAFAMPTPVLLLDEPTQGLDPIERLRFTDALAAVSSTRTVLYSTHVVSDVDAVAARVLVLDQGRLVFDGTTDEMRATSPPTHTGVVDEDGLALLRDKGCLTAVRRINDREYEARWFGADLLPDSRADTATLTDAYFAMVGRAD